MILDILILAILAVPIVMGAFKGFTYMFLHTLSWIVSFIAAFFLTGPVSDFLSAGIIGDAVSGTLIDKLTGSEEAVDMTIEGLPGIIGGGITTSGENTSAIFANYLTNVLMSILTFLILAVLIWLILGLLTRPFLKARKTKILRTFDRLLGVLAGVLEGVILIFVFLVALVLLINFSGGGIQEAIVENLEESFIAGRLYDSNLLLLVTGGFFS